jgi:hypothetical protein
MPIEEEHIATLVHPDEYARNVNQIATLTTHTLVFVKRKELALKPFEIVRFPLSECSSISYESRWAVVPMIFGALLVALIVFIFAFLSQVPDGTRVPIGALSVAFVFGVVLFRGPKRHRLTFVVNGRKLKWQSKAGDFKHKMVSVQRAIAFAKERGLLNEFTS